MTWYRIPSRQELRRRKWEKKKRKIRKITAAVTGIAGFILAMGIEQNLWFALPALGLIAVTLVLQTKR